MSNKIIKGLTIQIGADTLGLDKALKDVEAKGKTASSELREINSAIKITGDSTALWEQKQKLLNDALAASREKVKVLEDAQKGFTERFKNGEIDKGTYDKFRDKLTKSRDKLNDLKSQQEQFEAKFKSGEIDQGEYDDFRKSVEKAEKKVKDLEMAEHSMEENLRLGNISEEQYRAFQRETEYARTAVKKYEDGLKEANQKVIELGNESDNTADDVKELGDKADHTASGGISAMTVALGNLVADGIKKAGSELKDFTKDVIQTGADFEAAMSNVAAISGADKSGLEQLTAKAEEMGATTKFTARESADAFQYMAMAGWKTEDMLGGIEGIMSLAAASGEDLATTSDIVTDALTAFGLTAEDAGHFADVLAAASSNANTNVAMMGETFKYVAPIAGALDFSVEDTAEAIGIMANSGIKASQAGTSLRAILTAMTDTSDKAYFAFQELNVETLNADGSMRGLNEILSDLRTSWQGLTEAEQADYAQRIAGKQAMSGFLSLVNAAPADIDKLSGAIRDCDGAASDMSTTMVDNLQGDMTKLGSAIDGMKISLSKELSPAMRDITDYITKNVPNIEKVLKNAGKKAIDLIEKVVKNLPKIVDIGKKLIPVVKGVAAGFVAWKLANVASDVFDLVKKIQGAGGLVSALAGLAAANPLGAFAVGVGAAVTALTVFRQSAKDAKSDTDIFIEEQEEYQRKCRESIEEVKNLKIEADKNAAKINLEFGDTESKWRELQSLVDQNGIIKQGYENRVQYIVNELTDATGVEIQLVDGQIQKYQKLKDTIQKTIDKQRAQRLFAAYSENEAELYTKQAEAQKKYFEKNQLYEDAEQNYRNVKETSQDAIQKYYDDNLKEDFFKGLSLEEALMANPDYFAADTTYQRYQQYIMDAAAEARSAKKSMQDARESHDYYTSEIDWLMQADNLIAEEEYNKATRLLTSHNDEYKRVVDDKNKTDEERREAYKSSLDKMNSDLDLANRSAEKGYKDSAKRQVQNIADAFAENVDIALESGVKSADVFDDNFKRTFKRLLQNGADVSAIGDILKKHGLKWGKDLGLTTEEQMELAIKGQGLSLTDVVDSMVHGAVDAVNADPPVVTVAVKPDFWELNEFLAGFDSGFSGFVGKLTSNIPMFANGGFLPSGQGIVAEAGPELIEIMNGGAKITPLTGNARNTAVSGADGNRSRVVYINNTINANVSGSYDVRRLAEDLAGEQRRVERNMGL